MIKRGGGQKPLQQGGTGRGTPQESKVPKVMSRHGSKALWKVGSTGTSRRLLEGHTLGAQQQYGRDLQKTAHNAHMIHHTLYEGVC